MKRSPMPRPDLDKRRSKPLKRGKGLRRSNPKRRAKVFARNYGDRGQPIREMVCLAAAGVAPPLGYAGTGCPQCSGRMVAAHATARGMGGAKGDRFDLVPLCWAHHEEAGEARTSQRAAFEARYHLDLQAEAARIADLLTVRGYE